MRGVMVGALLVFWSGVCLADVLEVSPAEIVALSADSTGVYRVALRFDLSGMREGEGRKIDGALLQWAADGLTKDETYGFTAYAAGSPWTTSGVQAQEDTPAGTLLGDESLVVPKEM